MRAYPEGGLTSLSMILVFWSLAVSPAAAVEVWRGPIDGPPAPPGKRIIVVAEDMRNDGIDGIVNGLTEAAEILGWRLTILDAAADPDRLTAALTRAIADDIGDGGGRADGIVLAGLDAVRNMPDYGTRAEADLPPLVGWHVGPQPGAVPSTPVALNVTSDPKTVARLAADLAIEQSPDHAGIVILTDYRYAIAVAKARAMANRIRGSAQCALLEIIDMPLAETATRMPAEIARLEARYGVLMTGILAINDLYFDDATAELARQGIEPNQIMLISAGDGSPSARDRIARGYYQTATVAEPLTIQAWQLLDELNRLMAHQPISGFVAEPIVVTHTMIGTEAPDFRAIYRRIWQR